jgi:hypothetical protein
MLFAEGPGHPRPSRPCLAAGAVAFPACSMARLGLQETRRYRRCNVEYFLVSTATADMLSTIQHGLGTCPMRVDRNDAGPKGFTKVRPSGSPAEHARVPVVQQSLYVSLAQLLQLSLSGIVLILVRRSVLSVSILICARGD